jgi:hypothetical protein
MCVLCVCLSSVWRSAVATAIVLLFQLQEIRQHHDPHVEVYDCGDKRRTNMERINQLGDLLNSPTQSSPMTSHNVPAVLFLSRKKTTAV